MIPKPMTGITNTDLQVSIAKLEGKVDSLVDQIATLTKAIEGGVVDRRSGEGRISQLELSASESRGAIRTGKYFLSGIGVCVFTLACWTLKSVSDATDVNRLQELSIITEKEQIMSLQTRMTTEEAQINAILRDQLVTKSRDK